MRAYLKSCPQLASARLVPGSMRGVTWQMSLTMSVNLTRTLSGLRQRLSAVLKLVRQGQLHKRSITETVQLGHAHAAEAWAAYGILLGLAALAVHAPAACTV